MDLLTPPTLESAPLELGQAIARARILRSLTQEELAKRCQVSRRAIQQLEAGENTSLHTWLAAATELGYLRDLLYTFSQDKPVTMEQFRALSEGTLRRRRRVRHRATP